MIDSIKVSFCFNYVIKFNKLNFTAGLIVENENELLTERAQCERELKELVNRNRWHSLLLQKMAKESNLSIFGIFQTFIKVFFQLKLGHSIKRTMTKC